MTLSGSADARVLLRILGSVKLLERSGFFAVCRICEALRRRMMKMEMTIKSIVAADAESSWKAMQRT